MDILFNQSLVSTAVPGVLHLGQKGLANSTISNITTTITTTSGFNMSLDMAEDQMAGNQSDPVFTTPTYTFIWVTLANVLVLLVGLLGNSLVIVVVSCVRDMRTPTNLCLMNLSVADLLVLLICQPSALLEFYEQEKWMLGDFMCRLTVFLENTVCLASILIILSVSFERYYAVCYPLKKYSTQSHSKALLLMLIMWVAAAALTSPFFVISHTITVWHFVDKENVTMCTSPILSDWQYSYIICRFVLVFLLPLCLLIFLYSRIIFKVTVDTMESRQMTDKARAQVQRSRQQLVIMLIGVVVLFFVCLLPFRIMALYEVYRTSTLPLEARLNLMHLVRLLVYINSAGNPIIYSLVSTKFRRAFVRVLHHLGCRWAGRVDDNGTSRRNTISTYTSVRQEHDDSSPDAL